MLVSISSPFGSRSRTRILLALRLLAESYPSELARILGTRLFAVQKALLSLERDGLVAGRTRGRTRLFRLNPAYFAFRELQPLLLRLASADRDLVEGVGAIRRRPRRTGKPL